MQPSEFVYIMQKPLHSANLSRQKTAISPPHRSAFSNDWSNFILNLQISKGVSYPSAIDLKLDAAHHHGTRTVSMIAPSMCGAVQLQVLSCLDDSF